VVATVAATNIRGGSVTRSVPPVLGTLLRTIRAASNLKQWQLADMAELDPPTLSRIESGRQAPTEAQLARLCDVLPTLREALVKLSSVETRVG
jgi:transcriptional regulator with XRE-family HTH domain